MAKLRIHNMPEKLYKRIQKLAKEGNLSVSAAVIQLLSRGLEAHEFRRNAAAVIARIRKRTQRIELPGGWKDSAELIREGRSRCAWPVLCVPACIPSSDTNGTTAEVVANPFGQGQSSVEPSMCM